MDRFNPEQRQFITVFLVILAMTTAGVLGFDLIAYPWTITFVQTIGFAILQVLGILVVTIFLTCAMVASINS